MVQKATVLSVDGRYAEIEVSRQSMCGGCHKMKCGGCSVAALMSSGGKMKALAVNKAEASVGDSVEIETLDREVLKAAVAVFLFPIIFGGIFYAAALYFGLPSDICAISSIAGFLLLFLILRIAEKKLERQEPKIVVSRILEADSLSPENDESGR